MYVYKNIRLYVYIFKSMYVQISVYKGKRTLHEDMEVHKRDIKLVMFPDNKKKCKGINYHSYIRTYIHTHVIIHTCHNLIGLAYIKAKTPKLYARLLSFDGNFYYDTYTYIGTYFYRYVHICIHTRQAI